MSSKNIVNYLRIAPRDTDFLSRRVGSKGEIFFDRETSTLRLMDGAITGGILLAKNDLSNVSNSDFLSKATAAGVGGGGGNTTVTVSDTAPESPEDGNLWLRTTDDVLLVYKEADEQWLPSSGSLATVATSGAYADLTGTPTLATVATSGAYADLSGRPTLATVATSGAYADLSGTPTIPSIGSLTFTGTTVDTDDSSALSFVPAVVFNSDLTVENDLSVGAKIVAGDIDAGNLDVGNIIGDTSDLVTILAGSLYMARDNTDINIDDRTRGTIYSLAMSGKLGFRDDGPQYFYDFTSTNNTETRTIDSFDAVIAQRINSTSDINIRWAFQSLHGSNPCGIAFHSGVAVDVLRAGIGQLPFNADETNAVILGYNSGPRIVVQSEWLSSPDPANPVTDVITLVGQQLEFIGTASFNSAVTFSGAVNITSLDTADSSAITVIPSASFNADVTVDNDLTVSSVSNLLGDTFISRTYEQTHAMDAVPSGAVIVLNNTDQERGSVYYLTNLAGNFTADFGNVSLTGTKTVSYAIIIAQGATAYMPTAMRVNGASVSPKWSGGGGTPPGNANYVDVVNVTILVNSGSVAQVLASLSPFV